MRFALEDDRLVAFLDRRLDSSNAPGVEQALSEALLAHPGAAPVVDLRDTDYISSAGLRVLLRLSKRSGQKIVVRGVSPEVYDILELTGFTTFLDVRRRIRAIDLSTSEIIGRGAVGTVYRIDEDTVAKMYDLPDGLAIAEREKERARAAFLMGVPTAIPYDVVEAQGRYGLVFEMVRARSANEQLLEHPDQAEDIVSHWADFVRQVHALEPEQGALPDAREVYLGYLNNLACVVPDALRERLERLLRAIPEDRHVVHGDIHMKNVMLSGDEPLLIDMDTLAQGDPVFDHAGLYVAYRAFNEAEPDNSLRFMGLDADASDRVWRAALGREVGACAGPAFERAAEKVRAVACIRFLFLLAVVKCGRPELDEKRISDTLRTLSALSERVGSLALREQTETIQEERPI